MNIVIIILLIAWILHIINFFKSDTSEERIISLMNIWFIVMLMWFINISSKLDKIEKQIKLQSIEYKVEKINDKISK